MAAPPAHRRARTGLRTPTARRPAPASQRAAAVARRRHEPGPPALGGSLPRTPARDPASVPHNNSPVDGSRVCPGRPDRQSRSARTCLQRRCRCRPLEQGPLAEERTIGHGPCPPLLHAAPAVTPHACRLRLREANGSRLLHVAAPTASAWSVGRLTTGYRYTKVNAGIRRRHLGRRSRAERTRFLRGHPLSNSRRRRTVGGGAGRAPANRPRG